MNMSSAQSGEFYIAAGKVGEVDRTGLSLLATFAGAEFALRSSYVLVTARWLNVGTEGGVVAGIAISAVLAVAALLCAIGRAEFSIRSMSAGRAFAWAMAYISYAGLSLLWSGSTSVASSALYWSNLVADIAVVGLLCRIFGVERAVNSIMAGFIAASCFTAILAWMMPAAEDLRLGDMDYFNTNQIANLCALALLMTGVLRSRGHRIWAGVAALLGLTLCRSLSKATLIAFVVCVAYRMAVDRGMGRRSKWLLILSAAAASIIFFGLWEQYFEIYTTAGNQAETFTGRTAIWAWSLDAGLHRPWFGNGFDAMWKVAPPFGGDLFEARHAENELLQQFFAYGVCGIALLIGVYGSLYRQFRLITNISERATLVAILVYVLVRGLAEAEPFDLLLPLWMVAALSFLCVSSRQRMIEGR